MKNRRGNPLARFSGSYLLLLAVPLVMCVLTYVHTVDITRRQVARENTLRMEQLAEQMEKSMAEADHFALSLEKITEISAFTNGREQTPAQVISEMNEAVRVLPEFRDSNGLFSRYSIFTASGMVLEPDKGYLFPEKYYDEFFRYDDMSYAQWRDMLFSMRISSSILLPARSTVINTRADPVSGRALLYIRPFPLAVRQQGYVIFYLQEDALIRRFESQLPDSATEYALLSAGGDVLMGMPELGGADIGDAVGADRSGSRQLRLAGQGTVTTWCRLRDNGYLLVSATPQAVFSAQAMQVISPMLFSLAALFLVGAALTLMVWHSNRKPLLATLDKLQVRGRDGLWQMDQAVLQLINDNSHLQRSLEDQRLALRSALFNRLYNGDITDPREVTPLLRKLGVPLKDGCFYRGVVLRFRPRDAAPGDLNEYLSTLLSAQLSPASDRLFFLSPADPDTLLLLHVCLEDDPRGERVTRDLRRVYAVLQEQYQVDASFYVGYPVSAVSGIAYSFAACRRLKMEAADMEWLHLTDRPIMNGYCYTPADEQALMTQLRAGHEEELRDTLRRIEEKNLQRNLSALQMQMLGYRMLDTVLQLDPALLLTVEMLQPLRALDLPGFFAQLTRLYQELAEQAEASRQQKASQLAADVIAYIDAHYDEYEMSLSTLSVRFGVTEKYLSAFIKKKLGVNFLTYLEGLRMSRADELLVDSDLTIEQIARQVGYANGKAFRRVYQRVIGQSPSLRRASGADELQPTIASDAPASGFYSPLQMP